VLCGCNPRRAPVASHCRRPGPRWAEHRDTWRASSRSSGIGVDLHRADKVAGQRGQDGRQVLDRRIGDDRPAGPNRFAGQHVMSFRRTPSASRWKTRAWSPTVPGPGCPAGPAGAPGCFSPPPATRVLEARRRSGRSASPPRTRADASPTRTAGPHVLGANSTEGWCRTGRLTERQLSV